MQDKVVIRVSNVSKHFRLPHERATTMKSKFTNILKGKTNKTIKTQNALQNISFEIQEGEFFGIVGRNGSGKSTLLKMLAGIYQPTKGKLQVRGKLVPFIELGVGFNPELTGRENVYLNGALLGFSKKEVNSFYQEVVEFAELKRFMDQKLKNYSSGMQVRLAFSMAIQAKADILLIDEVLAVGDADFQRKCFEYFRSLKRERTTVVFVSHDMEAVRQYCDRAVLIDNSRLIERGDADKVAEAYLRQFSLDTTTTETADYANRWGDRGIEVTKIVVSSDAKKVLITETVQAKKPVEECIVGLRIKTTAGEYITGTNTKLERIKVGPMKPGDKRTISWSIPNVLSDGSYFIDPAILYSDEITVADWWNEATRFTIRKQRKLPYLIDPGFKAEINE